MPMCERMCGCLRESLPDVVVSATEVVGAGVGVVTVGVGVGASTHVGYPMNPSPQASHAAPANVLSH